MSETNANDFMTYEELENELDEYQGFIDEFTRICTKQRLLIELYQSMLHVATDALDEIGTKGCKFPSQQRAMQAIIDMNALQEAFTEETK